MRHDFMQDLLSHLKAYFKSLLKPEFSARDTSPTKRQQEEATFLYLLDFLEEWEGNFHPWPCTSALNMDGLCYCRWKGLY